ncbi:MAG: hypothetical protein JWL62_3858 [Hyphomicrobiales bacterium]|nr:hypothetical protein [Hyphomicrobiales bacterium]
MRAQLPPRLLTKQDASRYCGMGVQTFERLCPVVPIRFTERLMSKSTISAFEAKAETATLQIMNNAAVVETLERAGLVFVPDEGKGRGILIGKPMIG